MGRIANFIDGAYLEKLRECRHCQHIDFHILAERLAGEHDLVRTYYYDALPYLGPRATDGDRARFDRKSRFFDALSYIPRFEVRLGIVEYRGQGFDGHGIYAQKRVDVQMAVDLTLLAAKNRITDAAILAGDSDFLPGVEAAKSEGVVVHLFHGPNAHRDLIRLSDERTFICDDFLMPLATV
jgi:uncharacterized LabA/DUF88 family protein